ncbi:MAG: hypothetical protein AB7E72_17130, partial [Lysobacterales bacterium]
MESRKTPAADAVAWPSPDFLEGVTPLVIGQAERLLPFELRLRGGIRQQGGLLSLRSMADGLSLLLCRDQHNLERVTIPGTDLVDIRVSARSAEAPPRVEPAPLTPAPAEADGDPRWIADRSQLGIYLEHWPDDPELARRQLPRADLDRLARVMHGADLAREALSRAGRFGLPLLAPELLEADPAALALLAPAVARRLMVLPLLLRNGVLALAVADPARAGLNNQL